MNEPDHIATLEDVLDRVAQATRESDPVRIEHILDKVGQRSFGPLLLITGLIVLAPLIGDIPGVPTLAAVLVFLLSIQLLLEREHFWLPRWLLSRSVSAAKLGRGLTHLYKPVRVIDRWLHPRLVFLIRGTGTRLVALACLLVALTMPAMEFIPFSANIAGAALTLFGLALVSRDGLLALVAFVCTFGGLAVLIYAFVA